MDERGHDFREAAWLAREKAFNGGRSRSVARFSANHRKTCDVLGFKPHFLRLWRRLNGEPAKIPKLSGIECGCNDVVLGTILDTG